MRIDDYITVTDQDDDRIYSADQVIAAFEGTASTRSTIPATYHTTTSSPTVYFTALTPSGAVLTSRRTSGVTLLGSGLYEYAVPRGSDFVAVWDEGDAANYVTQYFMVGQ